MASSSDADTEPTAPDAAPEPVAQPADSMPSEAAAAPSVSTPAPAAADVPELLTPAEWAARKGIAPAVKQPWEEPISSDWRYHPADVLHGWSRHAYDYQAPADAFRLTESDFDAALAAAAGYPATPAHMPAVTKACPFRKEHIARADEAQEHV